MTMGVVLAPSRSRDALDLSFGSAARPLQDRRARLAGYSPYREFLEATFELDVIHS